MRWSGRFLSLIDYRSRSTIVIALGLGFGGERRQYLGTWHQASLGQTGPCGATTRRR